MEMQFPFKEHPSFILIPLISQFSFLNLVSLIWSPFFVFSVSRWHFFLLYGQCFGGYLHCPCMFLDDVFSVAESFQNHLFNFSTPDISGPDTWRLALAISRCTGLLHHLRAEVVLVEQFAASARMKDLRSSLQQVCGCLSVIHSTNVHVGLVVSCSSSSNLVHMLDYCVHSYLSPPRHWLPMKRIWNGNGHAVAFVFRLRRRGAVEMSLGSHGSSKGNESSCKDWVISRWHPCLHACVVTGKSSFCMYFSITSFPAVMEDTLLELWLAFSGGGFSSVFATKCSLSLVLTSVLLSWKDWSWPWSSSTSQRF